MGLKEFKTVNGLANNETTQNIITTPITSNSAVTIDTVALSSFYSIEYSITIVQGTKVRTSKIAVQTDGTNVDYTEYGVVSTGGAISGVGIVASASASNMILQVTITDAATTIARVRAIKNLLGVIQAYLPGAPTIGTATAGMGQATVTFTAPLDNGNSAITSYIVTSSPGNITASGLSSPITITGLTGYQTYTFTVTAVNSVGTSLSSSASNSVTPTAPIMIDYLVVAGGAAGGFTSSDSAGGGGAGGLRCTVGATGGGGAIESQLAVAASTNYTVTVGAGGGTNSAGSNSVFHTITSNGGGQGGYGRLGSSYSMYNGIKGSGNSGGSGGGGGATDNGAPYNANGPGGSGTSGQGYAGAAASVGGNWTAGGGGGAGAAGSVGNSASAGSGGNGGNGITTSISGSSITYAGGGGGHASSTSYSTALAGGLGGSGGGGRGFADITSQPIYNTAGTANRGGGGGGNARSNIYNTPSASNGGSGIIILRYSNLNTITLGAGLTGSTVTSGPYKITTITAGTGTVSWS